MTRFSAASSSMALRTVPWLTLKRWASSTSLGISSPGFHSPDCRLCVIRALICWYSGEKVGELPEPPEGPGPATGAVAPLAPAAVEVLLWLGGTGFIDQDFTTKPPPRPAKTTDNLAVLYKT